MEWEIAWRKAAAIAHENGLSLLKLWWPSLEIWKCLLEGRTDEVAMRLSAAEAQAAKDGPVAEGYVAMAGTWLGLLREEHGLALARAEKGLRTSTSATGYVASVRRAVVLTHLAPAFAACGRADEAIAAAREASSWFGPSNIGVVRYLAVLTEADALLSIDRDTEGLPVLAEALAIGRSGGHFLTIPWLPKMMVRLCTIALREGIEPDYVRDLATRRDLQLPP